MKRHASLSTLALATLILTTHAASASEGHDHGAPAAANAGPALPRFAVASETFELVGELRGKQLTLYLDRFDDNAPVVGARMEVDVGGEKLIATGTTAQTYEVTLKSAPADGVLPVTATITAGTETDLLVGELDIHHGAHDAVAAHGPGRALIAGWVGAGAFALALLAWLARRRMAPRAGGVA